MEINYDGVSMVAVVVGRVNEGKEKKIMDETAFKLGLDRRIE